MSDKRSKPDRAGGANVWHDLARMEAEIFDPDEGETVVYTRSRLDELTNLARQLREAERPAEGEGGAAPASGTRLRSDRPAGEVEADAFDSGELPSLFDGAESLPPADESPPIDVVVDDPKVAQAPSGIAEPERLSAIADEPTSAEKVRTWLVVSLGIVVLALLLALTL
jgi:hypothetical protein